MTHRLHFALALALALTPGCKKKQTEDTGSAPKPSEGSAMAAPGSAMAPGTGSAAAAPAPAKQTPKTGKDLAAAYMACSDDLNTGKFDDFKANCVAKDFVGHADGEDDTKGSDALIAGFKGIRSAFPDFKVTPVLVLVDGRDIFAVAHMTGTQQGTMKTPMGDVPATNKKFGTLMFHRLAMNDENKATEEWEYDDALTMMSQLGLSPKGAPPMRAAMDKGPDLGEVVVVSADDANEKANIDTAKKMTDAVNSHKTADALAFLTDDAFESDQASASDAKGKADVKKGLDGFLKAFPDVKLDVPTYYAGGNWVVALGTMSGTNTGAMGKMKPTGKQVSGSYAEVMMVKGGKISQVWRFRNGMAMATQLGLMPAAGSGAAPGAAKDAPKMAPKKK